MIRWVFSMTVKNVWRRRCIWDKKSTSESDITTGQNVQQQLHLHTVQLCNDLMRQEAQWSSLALIIRPLPPYSPHLLLRDVWCFSLSVLSAGVTRALIPFVTIHTHAATCTHTQAINHSTHTVLSRWAAPKNCRKYHKESSYTRFNFWL